VADFLHRNRLPGLGSLSTGPVPAAPLPAALRR
jgi:hypothetical protein